MPKSEPKIDKTSPKHLFQERVRELVKKGYTQRELAESIWPGMGKRSVEPWVQGLSTPPDWVCFLILEKWSKLS